MGSEQECLRAQRNSARANSDSQCQMFRWLQTQIIQRVCTSTQGKEYTILALLFPGNPSARENEPGNGETSSYHTVLAKQTYNVEVLTE